MSAIKNIQLEKYLPAVEKIINERLGIIIHKHQKDDLLKIMANAIDEFKLSAEQYIEKLSFETEEAPIIKDLVSKITIGETYFFRDKNQMELLKKTILPDLIAKKRKTNHLALRIWSAGCSSGEEIYTLLLLLHELIPDIHAWSLQLLGTDINPHALKKAIDGTYSDWSMRSIDDYYVKKYFNKINNQFVIHSYLRDQIQFIYLNLSENTYPSIFNGTNAQDLILCRNVLIYFDTNHIEALMKNLSHALLPGGYLLLGASDPINIKKTDLIYHHSLGPVFTLPDSEMKETHKIPIETPKPLKIEPPLKPKTTIQLIKTTSKMDVINELIKQAKWEEALNAINKSTTVSYPLLNAKATALANIGKLELAEKTCIECLTLFKTHSDIYFTYALILIELNKTTEAETILKKVLFLNNKNVPGYYQLGLLQIKNKNIKSGIKNLTNALVIA